MNVGTMFFWIAVAIVAWIGFRNLMSMITGLTHTANVKRGQRLCHATSLALYWGACILAILYRVWWPLAIGVFAESLFRKSVIRSGVDYF